MSVLRVENLSKDTAKAGAQGHNLRISYGHKRFAWTKRRRQDHHNELHIGRDKKSGGSVTLDGQDVLKWARNIVKS